jgi:hypothetical protein
MWNWVFFVYVFMSGIYGAIPDEESCHSFGGGSVYPLGVNPEKAEHKLQWTQAVSE